MKFAATRTLRVTYLEDGDAEGWPIILSHGIAYDVHDVDEPVPLLVRAGAHVIRPHLPGLRPDALSFRRCDANRPAGCPGTRHSDFADAFGANI